MADTTTDELLRAAINTQNTLTQTVSNKIDQAIKDMAPTGCVAFFARNLPPQGWLKCDGAELSRSTYADLFAAIGTSFGNSSGPSTFKLPDLRGEFVRGWDDGRGVDGGRSLGSWQKGSALAAESPRVGEAIIGLSAGNGTDTGQTHRQALGYDDDANALVNYNGTTVGYSSRNPELNSGDWMHTASWGGGVARPRNVALLACIKY